MVKEFALTPSRREGLYMQYLLKKKGVSFSYIANYLGVKKTPVSLVVFGSRHSARIEFAVANALGYATWNNLVRSVRKILEKEIV